MCIVALTRRFCGKSTEFASYDYSGAEQPLWMTYFYLKELYKYQTPKVVVVDMYAPARFKEDYQYDWIAENITA